MIIKLVVFLTVLSGCSTPYLYSLQRSGKTDAQFERDHYACELDMRAVAHSFYYDSPREFHHRCMTAKGYVGPE